MTQPCGCRKERVLTHETADDAEIASCCASNLYNSESADERHANTARIVLCVNALAGMTEAEIDTMVQTWKERER